MGGGMDGKSKECMGEWMGGWMCGQMDGWMLGGQADGWIVVGWVDGKITRWMDVWMMDGCMDGDHSIQLPNALSNPTFGNLQEMSCASVYAFNSKDNW